jgi:uncharacterized protein (TIGR03435 family)
MTTLQRQQYRQALLQGLLNQRFQLKLHSDTKEMSIYALEVGKDGPKLKDAQAAPAGPPIKGRAGSLVGTGASMTDLANELKERAGRRVEDMTGLKGRYDFKLDWTPDSLAASATTASDAGDLGPDLFTAIQQQLGLKLEARKRTAAYEVIENVQLPAEN